MQYATYCITTIFEAESYVLETYTHYRYNLLSRQSLEPSRLTLHLPTYHCRIGLLFCLSVQTMRESNPNLHIDSVICNPLHYIAYIVESLGIEPRFLP